MTNLLYKQTNTVHSIKYDMNGLTIPKLLFSFMEVPFVYPHHNRGWVVIVLTHRSSHARTQTTIPSGSHAIIMNELLDFSLTRAATSRPTSLSWWVATLFTHQVDPVGVKGIFDTPTSLYFSKKKMQELLKCTTNYYQNRVHASTHMYVVTTCMYFITYVFPFFLSFLLKFCQSTCTHSRCK